MPLDEVALKKCVTDINTKLLDLHNQQSNIRRIQENLNEITELRQQSISDAGVVKITGHIPKDKRTGKPFTDNDRQKIYDDNMAEAALALG